MMYIVYFFFQAEDGILDGHVTGVQTCALPISWRASSAPLAGSIRRISPGSLAITRSPSSVSASRAYWKEPSNRQRGLPSSGARHHVSAMLETITPPSGSTVTASFHGP